MFWKDQILGVFIGKKNQLIFGEDIDNHKVGLFSATQCITLFATRNMFFETRYLSHCHAI